MPLPLNQLLSDLVNLLLLDSFYTKWSIPVALSKTKLNRYVAVQIRYKEPNVGMQKVLTLTIVSTAPLICLNTPCPLNPSFSNQLLYNKISSESK